MFKLYKFSIYILIPFIKLNLLFRIKKNKEEKNRIKERFGITKHPRPKGKLIWIHASSVGEFNSTTGLINELLKSHKILLTTSTVTAYHYSKQIFNNKIIHQYVPIDHEPWVKKFLNYWYPDSVIWVESDLWPNIIRIISERKISSVLLNLRISPKSFRRWILIKNNFSQLIEYFDKVFVQSKNDLEKVKKLSKKRVYFIGNLKFTSLQKKYDENKLNKIKKNLYLKKIILIASSHQKEEALIFEEINKLLIKRQNIFVVVVPRHPERSKEVLNYVRKIIPNTNLESNNITIADLDCLIVDSLGEMPIYYKLSDIVILGGSFVNLGGHNPLEPANYNCSILTGPSIFNWQSIYNEMIDNKCCILCKTTNELGYNIESILNNNKLADELKINAFNYSNKKQNIINDVLSNINPYIKGIKNA